MKEWYAVLHLDYPMLAKSVYKEAAVKVVARRMEKKIGLHLNCDLSVFFISFLQPYESMKYYVPSGWKNGGKRMRYEK